MLLECEGYVILRCTCRAAIALRDETESGEWELSKLFCNRTYKGIYVRLSLVQIGDDPCLKFRDQGSHALEVESFASGIRP